MNPYKSCIVLTTLKLNEDKTGCVLDLPFKIYAKNVVANGIDITYSMDNNPKLAGTECIAKVDYLTVNHPSGSLADVDQSAIAEAFEGNLGQDWEVIKKDVRYIKHYNVTKETALATTDELGVKVPYDGADKDEVVKFTQWEVKAVEEVPEVPIEEIIKEKI